jgi:hypothetical protein
MMSNNSRVMNSLLPPSTNINSTASQSSLIYVIMAISIAALVVGMIYYFFEDSVSELWKSMFSTNLFSSTPPPSAEIKIESEGGNGVMTDNGNGSVTYSKSFDDRNPLDVSGAVKADLFEEEDDYDSAPIESKYTEDVKPTVGKVVPEEGGPEVYNISKNTFTYNDAEPLCKALGAELATYDQVKEAWSKGADWCNYGWTKGQMAVYPTSNETYDTLQKGTAEQQLACGRPGLNGGYFDNPELRFGVNCYGPKPPQNKHDQVQAVLSTPVSPEEHEFDKKVAEFKEKAESIGILPFNKHTWQ